jgi:DNA replication protein DnaC
MEAGAANRRYSRQRGCGLRLRYGRTRISRDGASLHSAEIQRVRLRKPALDDRGLLLMGGPGVGKTHLAIAALRDLIKRGHNGYFCEYGSLLRQVQASYRPDSDATEMSILDPVLRTEVLVLDDLGVIKPSDWVRDIVGYILNKRYVDGSLNLDNRRCTIITTNYLDKVDDKKEPVRDSAGRPVVVHKDSLTDRIGERTRSRLFEICKTLQIDAPDFRRFSKQQAGRARA